MGNRFNALECEIWLTVEGKWEYVFAHGLKLNWHSCLIVVVLTWGLLLGGEQNLRMAATPWLP